MYVYNIYILKMLHGKFQEIFHKFKSILLWAVCWHLLSPHTILSTWIILFYKLKQGSDLGHLCQQVRKLRKVVIHNPDHLLASSAACRIYDFLENLRDMGIINCSSICFQKCHLGAERTNGKKYNGKHYFNIWIWLWCLVLLVPVGI